MSAFFCLSVATALVTAAVGDIVLFGALFGITIIMFAAALTRKTIVTCLISCLLWFTLSFAVWSFGAATSALTQGGSVTFALLGVVMIVLTIYATFEAFAEAAKEKERSMVEGEVL